MIQNSGSESSGNGVRHVGAGQAGGPVQVLLVEDNVGFAYGVRDMLVRKSREPFEVTEARTLADAIRVLTERRVDVVLLDLGLPDSTRMETFSRTSAHAGYAPILILTVLDDDEVALEAMRLGAQDYLVKDRVETHLLVRSIKYAMERTRIERTLHDLSARLLHLQDEERRRIARDLHDVTAQNLAALSMNLAALEANLTDLSPASRRSLSVCRECLSKCTQDLRTATYLLHPPLLEELGLAGAVRDYADGFAVRSGIRVDLELAPQIERLPKEMEITLFRVMQECLTNIHRHSGSATASIRFERTDGRIGLQVRDSGRGMRGAPLPGGGNAECSPGVGIAGMRERVRQMRGDFEVFSSDKGTTVNVRLPIHRETP